MSTKVVVSLLTLSALCLIGVVYLGQNKFVVGDCFVDKDAEVWELDNACEIKQVGKHKYLFECPTEVTISQLYNLSARSYITKDEEIEVIDKKSKKTSCPIKI